jgi:hypothetical protein
MPRKHQGALTIQLTPADWDSATRASSRSCLIADAIARQYPHLRRVRVDLASIRATDTRTDERLMWITPQSAALILLHFDQGWDQPQTLRFQTRRPAHVAPVTRSPAQVAKRAEKAAARRAELEAKPAESLTVPERQSLSRLQNPRPKVDRPAKRGKTTGVQHRDGSGTKIGGEPQGVSKAPAMLGAMDRQYGGRRAEPSAVWTQAVDAEIQRRKEAGQL